MKVFKPIFTPVKGNRTLNAAITINLSQVGKLEDVGNFDLKGNRSSALGSFWIVRTTVDLRVEMYSLKYLDIAWENKCE